MTSVEIPRDAQAKQPWHEMPVQDCLTALQASPSGLANADIPTRVTRYGLNELAEAEPVRHGFPFGVPQRGAGGASSWTWSFHGEHRVILQVLDVLAALAKHAVGDHRLPLDHARQALDVLSRFADHCHHGKEEDVLFPVLERIQPGFAPLRVMLGEHVEGRAFHSAMSAAVTADDAAGFAAAATGYIALLRQHIDKENHILFPLAQRMLSAAQDAAILDGYRRLEHDDLGDGTHERLLGIADTLATAYGIPRASDDPQVMNLLTAICGCRKE